jgi:hypothetical protein
MVNLFSGNSYQSYLRFYGRVRRAKVTHGHIAKRQHGKTDFNGCLFRGKSNSKSFGRFRVIESRLEKIEE